MRAPRPLAVVLAAAWLAAMGLGGCRPNGMLQRPGQVYVTTVPPDATVFCNGANRGQTPTTLLDLSAGDHLLRIVKPGFRDVLRTVSLQAGERAALDLRLEPQTAMLLIHTRPPGADLDLNGASIGKSPLLLRECPLGQHQLTARVAGHLPRMVNVSVADPVPQKIEIPLTSDSARIRIASAPPGAVVALDGSVIGKTPLDLPALISGKHILEMTLAGHAPYRSEFSVQAGEQRDINTMLVPLPGKLAVRSTPPSARIYLNDQPKGETPLDLNVPPGSYAIRAVSRGYDPQVRTSTVAIGTEALVEFTLDKSSGTILLTTEPPGVSVFLDGDPCGLTRSRPGARLSDQLEIEFVPRGKRTLQLSKPGFFEVSRPIEIAPQQTVILHEKLKARPEPFVPTVIVRTGIGPETTYRGVIRERYDNGDILLEIESGIFKTLKPADVLAIEPIPAGAP